MSLPNKQFSAIQIRRGSSSGFASANPILASGEPAFAIDTNTLKIGDGINPWSDLESIGGSGGGGGGSGTIILNNGNNRILTSTGSATGINAESNLTFDGSLLFINGDIIANSGTGHFDSIQLDLDAAPTLTQGQIGWNDTEGTVDIALTDDVTINIGEHSVYRVRNETGSVLYKGQVVYASGVHPNGIIEPNLYVADGTIREIRFIGLILENINDNNNGYAMNFGHIFNIDTRGNVASPFAVGDETWITGDILYVHPTVPGKLTNIEPKHSIITAIILDAASNGKIFVRPTSYGHLDDNHDVNVSGVTDGQYLQYNAATDYWIPTSSGTFSIVNIDNLQLDDNTLSATNTNGSIIVQTNGTGALQRDSNGNVRGQNAVDWQNMRVNNTQVAAGNSSVISGGNSNTALKLSSTVSGGAYNVASGDYSTVNGGRTNSALAENSSVAGGYNNFSTSIGSTVGGGTNNVAQGVDSTITGGSDNTAQGSQNTIGGGAYNNTNGIGSTVCGGADNDALNNYSAVGGGNENIANAVYSTVLGGFRGKTTRYGEISHASGRFANNGDAQHIILLARGLTISGTFSVDISTPEAATFTKPGHSLKVGDSVTLVTNGTLPTGLNTLTTYYVIADGLSGSTFRLSEQQTPDGTGTPIITSGTQSGTHTLIPTVSLTLNGVTGLTTQEKIIIPERSTWSFNINLSAYNSQDNNGGSFLLAGGLRRSPTTTTELQNTIMTASFLEGSFVTNLVDISADTDNNALNIRVTGLINKSIRWVATIDITQVSFGTP